MVDFKKKKRIRRILYSPIVLTILTIVLAGILWGVFGIYKKAELSAQNLEKEKKDLARLVIRQKNLTQSLDYLKTDQGVEDEIRTKFRAVKDGEMVAIIIDNPTTSPAVVATTTSFWSRLFY